MAAPQGISITPSQPDQTYRKHSHHQQSRSSYSYSISSGRPYSSITYDSSNGYTSSVPGYASVEMQSLTSIHSSQGYSTYTLDPPSYNSQTDLPLVPDKSGVTATATSTTAPETATTATQTQPEAEMETEAATKKPTQPPLTFQQTFRIESPRYHDLWAGILFLLAAAGFFGLGAYSLSRYPASEAFSGGFYYWWPFSVGLQSSTLMLLGFVALVALILGYAYFTLARIFTKQFIWVTGGLNVAVLLGTAGFAMYCSAWITGGILAVFGVFFAVAMVSWRRRVGFSVLMFRAAVDVARRFGHAYLVSFLGGFVTAVFGVWVAITLIAVWMLFDPDYNRGLLIGLVVYIVFAAYWITEWIKNTIHTSISGLYGSWYFSPRSPARNATRGAARRALTYNFGSIALGSLVVAILDFLRFLCHVAQGWGENNCALCFLGFVLSCIRGAIDFLNRYAFSYMALYGKNYFRSAKDTWKMIKDRGIDALINECLIGPVLTLGALFIAVVCAFLAFAYMRLVVQDWGSDDQYTAAVVAYTFLVTLQVVRCFTVPLSSGIDTIFVAAAWDPEILMREHPDLYQQMVSVFPQIQQSIHA